MAETVLLTGVSGFIAKHVALKLLNAGYNVRGTVRRLDRAAEIKAALQPYLSENAGQLSLVQADLESDAGWAEAMSGITAPVHTASPFPIAQPKDPAVVIRPAVEGTERVLKAAAAAGVTRVVLTSSTVAILNEAKADTLQDEADWCDVHLPSTTPYAKSKTLAERAAWEVAKARGLKLTTINPGLVLGPPLDEHYGSSLGLIERFLKGKDPMLPALGFPIVDVRDVAEMHLRALQRLGDGALADVGIGLDQQQRAELRRRQALAADGRGEMLEDGELGAAQVPHQCYPGAPIHHPEMGSIRRRFPRSASTR